MYVYMYVYKNVLHMGPTGIAPTRLVNFIPPTLSFHGQPWMYHLTRQDSTLNRQKWDCKQTISAAGISQNSQHGQTSANIRTLVYILVGV